MRKACTLLVAVALALLLPGVALARDYSAQEEENLGRQAAAELEREYRLLDNAEQLQRITAMLQEIAPVTERPNVVYRAKILDTADVNALSLPGGFIYVTRGLLEGVGSDDELAGVLAHEIAHNAHRHALTQLDKSARMDQKVMLAVLIALLAGGERVDPGSLIFLAQVLKLNALSGYGQKAELESDRSAVEYLVKLNRYNPVGILQFMEGLQREERRRPYIEPGIFRTHPPTPERVALIQRLLAEHGVPIVRLPSKFTPAGVARAVTVNGSEIAEVVVKEQPLYQPASDRAGKNPMQRAEEAARRVSEVFKEYAEGRHVSVRASGEEYVLLYRGAPILYITAEDARFHQTTAQELAQRAARVLKRIIWEDFVRHTF